MSNPVGSPAPTRKRGSIVLSVLRRETITPHMVRVVAGGPGLQDFTDNEWTDHYVKVVFKRPGVQYAEPFDMGEIRSTMDRADWPITRTYTVRSFDAAVGELSIDFVVHGDSGLAGPWAAQAEPGDELILLGPGGAYRPDPEADWHLLVGDASALPALLNAAETLPARARVQILIEVADAAEEQPFPVPVRYVHSDIPGAAILPAVTGIVWWPGRVQAFVHGEAGFVKELRRHLLGDRGIDKADLSISGYWRLGKNEDGFQAEKAEESARERVAAGS